jgi:hypothetical protein
MATIGVQWGNIPNPWGQSYSVGSSLASDSNTAAINQARTAGYLESLGHTNALHDQQRELYGAKTETERQAIEGRNRSAAAAKALAESNASPAGNGSAPAPVDPRAKFWGDLASGSQLQSNSATDAAGAALKTTGGSGVILNNDPTAVRKNMTLLGQSPNENTVVGANDTVHSALETEKTNNKIQEENAKPHYGEEHGQPYMIKDGKYSVPENAPKQRQFNDSDKGSARNTLLDPNATPEAKDLAKQALAGSDDGGDPMYSGGFDSKTVDGQARNYLNNYNDLADDDPRKNDPKVIRRAQEAFSIIQGKVDHWSTDPKTGQANHITAPGQAPTYTQAPPGYTPPEASVTPYGNEKVPTPPEWAIKFGRNGAEMARSGVQLDQLKKPSWLTQEMLRTALTSDGNMDLTLVNSLARTPSDKMFINAALGWLGPELRIDSGATVLPREYVSQFIQQIPLSNDTPDVVKLKSWRRSQALGDIITGLQDTNPAMAERISNVMQSGGLVDGQPMPPMPGATPAPADNVPTATGRDGKKIYFRNGAWGE